MFTDPDPTLSPHSLAVAMENEKTLNAAMPGVKLLDHGGAWEFDDRGNPVWISSTVLADRQAVAARAREVDEAAAAADQVRQYRDQIAATKAKLPELRAAVEEAWRAVEATPLPSKITAMPLFGESGPLSVPDLSGVALARRMARERWVAAVYALEAAELSIVTAAAYVDVNRGAAGGVLSRLAGTR